jgi:type III pantothenate kinase
MLLAIDVGNTNTKFALVADGEIRHRWRLSTDADRTADEYAVWLLQLMQLTGLDRHAVTAAIVSTVVPPTLLEVQTLCTRYFGIEPAVVGSAAVDPGILLDVDKPEEVGADRIVLAAAANAFYSRNAIVVAFGTATTFNVVVDGGYVGGAIAPGITLAAEALYAAAAKLPRIAIEPPPGGRALAQGTVPSMQSGVFLGYVGLVEGLVARIRREMGRPAVTIATGGLSGLLLDHTDAIDHADADLMIRGLAHIHMRNT